MDSDLRNSDLEKAVGIVAKQEWWTDEKEPLPKKIAGAVAEGIALGRLEGLQLAMVIIRNVANKISEAGQRSASTTPKGSEK